MTDYRESTGSAAPPARKRAPRPRKASSATRTTPSAPPPPPGAEPPDGGLRGHKRMAQRFAAAFAGRYAWTPGRGWLEWTGAYWRETTESGPWRGVHEVCVSALAELAGIPRPDWRDELYADVRACDSATGTAGVLRHAMMSVEISKRDEEFDQNPELFVCQNGTLELASGEFRASRPGDLMTLAAGVNYDPDATCPLYDSLFELYQPEPEIRAYIHRLGGAAMEGRQNLQQLIVNYGSKGGNGKGTIERAWTYVFGDYAHTMPVEALLIRRGYDQYKDEKAQLAGKRLVFVTEPTEGQKFDTGVVKNITGGGKMTSRAVYKASVTFPKTWLIMMSTNNRVSTPHDGGMARRLKEIGWNYKVPEGTERSDIDGLLESEGSGILNRLLAGWIAYRDKGIGEPASVSAATADYLAAVDPIAQFLDECVIANDQVDTPSASLYTEYTKWCADNGERPLSNKVFSPDIAKRGYVKHATKHGNVWKHIALVARDKEPWE